MHRRSPEKLKQNTARTNRVLLGIKNRKMLLQYSHRDIETGERTAHIRACNIHNPIINPTQIQQSPTNYNFINVEQGEVLTGPRNAGTFQR